MKAKRTNQSDAVGYIAQRRPFTASALTGSTQPTATFGYMPRAYADVYLEHLSSIDYVVHSYWTPIAWHLSDGRWVMPPVKYSRTTSKHQSVVRRAVEIALAGVAA